MIFKVKEEVSATDKVAIADLQGDISDLSAKKAELDSKKADIDAKIEDIKDKIDSYKESTKSVAEKLREAFGAGKASMVVGKLGSILSRRVGKSITFSEIPIEYTNAYGTFAGYLGNVGNNFLIKINFLLGKSDSIYSFDIYDGMNPVVPAYTVDVMGLNIVQVVEEIESNLVDDGVIAFQESSLKERGRPSLGETSDFFKMIDTFTRDVDGAYDAILDKPLMDVYQRFFVRWAKDKPRYAEIKPHFFVRIVKDYLFSKNLTNKTFRTRKKASGERQIDDPILADQLRAIVEDQVSVEEKFTMLRALVTQTANNSINSLIVTGSPGSGKSHETMATIKSLGLSDGRDYKVYKGGTDTEGLMRILYNSQLNNIPLLVFDDFDSALVNKSNSNIWKAILSVGSREVTYISKSKSELLKGIPAKFEFNSSVIFITNLPVMKLDSAIRSRSAVISIDISNEDMVTRLRDSLSKFMPEVDLKTKEMALGFLEEIHKGIETVDFRMLRNVIVAIQCGGSLWKKMALMLMTNAG